MKVAQAVAPRALQSLPGIQAASDISSGLYIRGGGPDQTLVLMDGVTVYNPTHAFGFFSTFNNDAVGGIEAVGSGEQVAVKIQRPGIRRVIEVDLEILLHLATLFGDLMGAGDTALQLKMIAHYAALYGFGGHADCEAIAVEIGEQAREVFPLFEFDPRATGANGYKKLIRRVTDDGTRR